MRIGRTIDRGGRVRVRRINGGLGTLGLGERETQILTGLVGAVATGAATFFGTRAGTAAGIQAISPALTALISQGGTPVQAIIAPKAPTKPTPTAPKRPALSPNVKIAIGATAGVALLGLGFLLFRAR